MKGWMKPKQAAEYYGVSVRTFREWLKKGFPCCKSPTGGITVEIEAGDQYLRDRSAQSEADRLNRVADEILDNL